MSNLLLKNSISVKIDDVWSARKRIAPFIRRTPLIRSNFLSDFIAPDASVFLKLENLQDTGAFKVRGAANAILSLSDEKRKSGVTTFSTGNHGLAVAYIAKQLGIRAVICISNDVPSAKVDAILRSGAEVMKTGHSQDEAQEECYRLNREEGLVVIRPFDDPNVIAGQGTIGLELLEDIPEIDTAIVPLSGGGLISGVALTLKQNHENIRIIGVSMEKGAAMYESIQSGHPILVDEAPTLADSLRGGIGLKNQYTFQMVHSLVDDIVLLPESAIADGMKFMLKKHHMAVEGAAATGIGAILHRSISTIGKNVAVIVSGNNVNDSTIREIFSESFPV